MKSVLIGLLVFAGACAAIADSSRGHFVSGHGWAARYCYLNSWNFCMDMVKQDAKDEAIRDGQNTCRALGGSLQSGYVFCRDYCSPLAPRPGNNDGEYITCNQDCDFTCQIKEP